MDHGTPAGVLEPTGDDPVVDDERQRALETDLLLATHLRVLSRVARASDHDLRSPLHTMTLYLELLKKLVEAPEHERIARQMKHIEVLESEVQNLELMLTYFFPQMSVESKGPERLDLVEVVHGILEFLEPYRRSVHVDMVWEPPPEPVRVTATKDSIRHALVYLLVSALDAAAQKHPEQDLQELRVQVLARDGLAILVATAPPGWSASIRGFDQEKPVKERGLEVTRRALQREHATLVVRSGASRPTILEIQMPLTAAEV
ncbi:MAG TPA: hypothetical protein VE402_06780 [Candidatus Angelobacter sp.]|nr:hypothetical protein [Candidatus Angelobacter sp.]